MVLASSFRSSPKCISFPLWRAFLSIPKATRQYINTRPYISTWYLDFCVYLGGPQGSRLLLPHLPPQTLSTHLPDAPAQIHFNHVTALFKNLQWHSPSHQTKTAWFSKCWIIVPNPTHTTVLSAALLFCVTYVLPKGGCWPHHPQRGHILFRPFYLRSHNPGMPLLSHPSHLAQIYRLRLKSQLWNLLTVWPAHIGLMDFSSFSFQIPKMGVIWHHHLLWEQRDGICWYWVGI